MVAGLNNGEDFIDYLFNLLSGIRIDRHLVELATTPDVGYIAPLYWQSISLLDQQTVKDHLHAVCAVDDLIGSVYL